MKNCKLSSAAATLAVAVMLFTFPKEALRRLLISQHQSAGIGLLVIFQQDLSQGKVVRV
jgi:hypothetical protein